ncbi:DnaJ domain-containing protein [Saccharospirillum salsuginis]|uniref:J domain-containing protein n=1 Tax=Saccharospirillum salsuginis TaxID=418750 RepID=A0A918KR13_9GAMM|nr:DnaJ domain-containing protein [Saccharospirillum salsuginis]GGX71294.1 hypothetical protein GCM10007392_43470 [Saccharospirillum salsuginis]
MNPFSLLLLLLALGGLFLYIQRQPPQKRARAAAQVVVALLLFAILYLALTRRLYLLGALLAFSLPFLRRLLPILLRALPFLAVWHKRRQQRKQSQANTGQQSTVRAALLEMVLDHDSGEMSGRILEGPMTGRDLADLGDDEFIELLQYCRQQDTESARLLETYLDRRFGEAWRQDDPGQTTGDDHQDSSGNTGDGRMTDTEAYEILGLQPGASRDEIIQAHRRLMQRLHPDRGGSPYLAARINAARSHLLGD